MNPSSQNVYVPIKAICEEMTAYGFSYKFGSSAPILQPWRLTEGKARKIGMLFEGEKAIRTYWEGNVRPKLPDEFYMRRDINDPNWIMEARLLCGFDGPDFKDRFAINRSRNLRTCQFSSAAAPVPTPSELTRMTSTSTTTSTSSSSAATLREISTYQNANNVDSSSSTRESRSNGGRSAATTIESKRSKAPLPSSTTTRPLDPASFKRKAESLRQTAKNGEGGNTGQSGTTTAPSAVKNGVSAKRSRDGGDPENRPSDNNNHLSGSSRKNSEGEGRAVVEHNDVVREGEETRLKKSKGPYMDQEGQAELFALLYARAAVLSQQELKRATTLVQNGDPKMIGLLLAFRNKEVDDKSQAQYKRVMEALLRRTCQ